MASVKGITKQQFSDFLAMGEDIDKTKIVCKRVIDAKINGKIGTYYGEWLLNKNLPHGRGVHVCKGKIYLNYYENGQVAGGQSIYIDDISTEWHVFRNVKARPEGKVFKYGTKYNADGSTLSGYFFDNKIDLECKVVRSGLNSGEFMDIGCDMPIDIRFGYKQSAFNYFGELSSSINEQGRGIRVYNHVIIIRYWRNADQAPGKFIKIWSDNQFEVGDWTLNA